MVYQLRTLAWTFVSHFVHGHLTLKEILDQISYQLAAVSRDYRAVSILRDWVVRTTLWCAVSCEDTGSLEQETRMFLS